MGKYSKGWVSLLGGQGIAWLAAQDGGTDTIRWIVFAGLAMVVTILVILIPNR